MTRLADAFGTDSKRTVRDDRILPVTRWTARIIAPILVAATVILFGFPDRTADLFAWTIRPNMTPLVMGAGYGTGAYFFYRVATAREWHRVGAVLPGIAAFTWFMAVATALHWENFNHAHPSFAAWTILYVASPFVIPAIWIRNQRTAPIEVDDAARLPRWIRRAAVVSGVLVAAGATFLFIAPNPLIEAWPWDLSPLTARILLGWFALFGVVNFVVGLDPRWSAARIPVQTQVIGFGLMLVGVGRAWNDFDAASPFTWAFLGGFVCYLLALSALYVGMERR